jgi:hypothetical protein
MPNYSFKIPPTLVSSRNLLLKMVIRTLNPFHLYVVVNSWPSTYYCKRWHVNQCYFLGKFCQVSTWKYDFNPYKGYSMEKMAEICQISIFFFPNCQIFMMKFQQVAKNIEGLWFFLLSYLVWSQIWLYHLMDDCHFSYITNLQKKPYCGPLWFNDV